MNVILRFLRCVDTLPPEGQSSLPKSPKLFWLRGMAGTGKSTVANTVAERIADPNENEFDLTSFFCKRDDPDLSDPKRFFPTIASNISEHNPSYRAALAALVHRPNGPSIGASDIKAQYEMLLGALLPIADVPSRRLVIIIDALDEYGAPQDQKILAGCILRLSKAVPWLTIFFTSRPELEIAEQFHSHDSNCTAMDIDQAENTVDDIQRLIEAELKKRDLRAHFTDGEITTLVGQAAGLFVWCSTLFKYADDSRDTPKKLRSLKEFLSASPPQNPAEQLYKLYDIVLSSVVNSDNAKDVADLHTFLGLIYVTASNRPLSSEALSTILRSSGNFVDEDVQAILNTLKLLRALLFEDDSINGAIRVHHPSFLDYVKKKLDERTFSKHQRRYTRSCLQAALRSWTQNSSSTSANWKARPC